MDNNNKETLKMKLIAISPVLGFDLTDEAFDTPLRMERDWRVYVPHDLAKLWRELNNYERHVIALTAYAQRPIRGG